MRCFLASTASVFRAGELLRIGGVERVPAIPEERADHLTPVVHHGHFAVVLLVVEHRPAVDGTLHLVRAIGDPAGAPLPGHGVGAARIGRKVLEDRRDIAPVGQVLLVEGDDHVGGDQHRDDVAGGDDDVVAGRSRLELRDHLLVALVGVVGHLHAELLLEVGDRVLRDVVRPVVDVQLLLDRAEVASAWAAPSPA